MGFDVTYRNLPCPAKVNLVLRIGPRLPSGFHKIQTVMAPLGWGDRLTLRLRSSDRLKIRGVVRPSISGLKLTDNLVYRAIEDFSKTFRFSVRADFTLQKFVPTGAGLGGGSSDAATALMSLARTYRKVTGKEASKRKIFSIAAQLGSDVPFFLLKSAAWCEGRGEKCRPLPMESVSLVLVLAKRGVNTAWAYRQLDESRKENRFRHWKLKKPKIVEPLRMMLSNDFEPVILQARRDLQRVQRELCKAGAFSVRMSGSGATFFGLFSSERAAGQARRLLERKGYFAISTVAHS